MSYLPCENPSCKSYGKPHPNCRCHNELAEGGEASFCSKERAHEPGCEYFAEGGETPPPFDEIPATETPPPFDDIPNQASEAPPAFDDIPDVSDENINLSPAELQAKMIAAAHPDGVSPYEAPGQQLATIAEGAAQGIAGPLAPLVETQFLGIDPDDIKAREEANPVEHGVAEAGAFAAGMLTGTGTPGLIAKVGGAAAKVAEAARLGKIGQGAIKGAVEMGLIHGSDEVSKAILGQRSPEEAVNPYLATGAMALFGLVGGGAGSKLADMAAKKIEGPIFSRMASNENFLAGIGLAASGGELPKAAHKALIDGYRFMEETVAGRLAEHAGGLAGSFAGKPGEWAGKGLGRLILKPVIGKATGKVSKYIAPTVVRWLQNGARSSLFNMIDYADKVAKGESLINNSIDAIFKGAAGQIPMAAEAEIEKLRADVDDGGLLQDLKEEALPEGIQALADGGEVKAPKKTRIHADHQHIADNFPEQNMLIQTARGRISSYLSAQRPQEHIPRLAFDEAPDEREQKKRYKKALEVAVNPLSILSHVQKGTIEPEYLHHMQAMYPELADHIRKKLTQRITEDQMEGKKPSFQTRQGLSMFMGVPLSSEFTPASIQAAQSVFARGKEQSKPQHGAPPKKSTSHLSKSDQSYLTDDQALARRQQRES